MRHSIYVVVCEFLIFQMLLMCGCVGVGNLLFSFTTLHHWVCSGCVVVKIFCIVFCWSAEIICLLGVCVVRKIEMLFEFCVRVCVSMCVRVDVRHGNAVARLFHDFDFSWYRIYFVVVAFFNIGMI